MVETQNSPINLNERNFDETNGEVEKDDLPTQKSQQKKSQTKAKVTKKVNIVDDNDDIDENVDVVEISNKEEGIEVNASPQPLLKHDSDGNLPEKLPDFAYKMLEKDFGHKSFRKHQEEAIIRIACGISSLVIMSTGYGKSLIYQFSAKLYAKKYPGSCVLVVSPLISLMQDQVQNLSKSLKAAMCDSQMSDKEFKQLIENLNTGNINVLFMSPEAIINRKIKYIPKLAFACIDEVHCLSQWSHNFRPSYLLLSKVRAC